MNESSLLTPASLSPARPPHHDVHAKRWAALGRGKAGPKGQQGEVCGQERRNGMTQ